MAKYSISFVVLVLFLGLMLGAVFGSLLDQVFGLSILNYGLFSDGSLTVIEDFYVIRKLAIQVTPGALAGLALTGYILYRKARA